MPPFLAARLRLLTAALWRRICRRPPDGRPATGTLRLSGLEQEVWICRDDAGVPQIYAGTLPDLGFGLGLAMAQDRLWQMETLRRLAGGRLAEILGDRPIRGGSLHFPGSTMLDVDRLYRSLRMYPVGREEEAVLSPDARGLLAGFASGVNAWLTRCRPRDLPLECLLTGIRPEPWALVDSLAVGKLIGWLLSLAFPAKPTLAALAARPTLRWALPPDLAHSPCILGDGPPPAGASLDLLARQALGLAGSGVGSNSWVLGGGRTASGKPLVCNDPHLLFALPALWYPVALHGPGHRVIGGAMPGIPAVLVGRNEHLAWGLTAVMADDGDYYRETLDVTGTRCLRDGAWQPVETVEESFRVRGQAQPARHTLRYVRHGGILCPLLAPERGRLPVSYRWVGLEPCRGLEAVLGMNRARTLADFEQAAQHFAVPAQNVVAADRQGNIAYFCTGKFPRRPWAGNGPALLDGASPRHAWQGYLTWAEHPRALNPPAEFVVTANNRVAGWLPPTIAVGLWEPPYRATRIAALLDACPRAGREDMARLQADDVSLQAAGILAATVRPVAGALRSPTARRAADLLLAWDCRLAAESSAAALYHLFYQALLTRCIRPVLEREAPGLFTRYLSILHLAVPAVDAALISGEAACFPGGVGAAVETCLTAAWERATALMGPDPAGWRWGSLHTLTLHHDLGRGGHWALRAFARLLDVNRGPYPRPGDGMTVNLEAFPLTAPFAVLAGPSYRQIVDLGAPEESRWIVAGGVSGDPRSRHYADQLDDWLLGASRPMRLRPREEAAAGASLRLVPTGGGDCVSPVCML